MLNLKSRMGKGLTAATVVLSMTVAGAVVLDAGPALAGHRKKTSNNQRASVKQKANTDQNGSTSGGRCINVSPSVGGVAIAPGVVVLGAHLIQIPIAVVAPPTQNGNQDCSTGGVTNNSTTNQGGIAANNGNANG